MPTESRDVLRVRTTATAGALCVILSALTAAQAGDAGLEAFNAFNHVNFGVPNLNIASGAFGRIGSTATEAREFQVGLKVRF
jgi:hypothetical protein